MKTLIVIPARMASHRFPNKPMELINNKPMILNVIKSEIGEKRYQSGQFSTASSLFSKMIKNPEFDEFLTLPAYELLN